MGPWRPGWAGLGPLPRPLRATRGEGPRTPGGPHSPSHTPPGSQEPAEAPWVSRHSPQQGSQGRGWVPLPAGPQWLLWLLIELAALDTPGQWAFGTSPQITFQLDSAPKLPRLHYVARGLWRPSTLVAGRPVLVEERTLLASPQGSASLSRSLSLLTSLQGGAGLTPTLAVASGTF